VINLAYPWLAGDSSEPAKEKKRRKRAPKFGKACAQALAEMFLRELGPTVKARVYNSDTGEYEAMLYTEEEEGKPVPPEERIKVYHGRENRDRPAA
jgi:hypothetical protein